MVGRTPYLILKLAVASLLAGFSAADSQLPSEDSCVTYLPGRFSEFLMDADGSVVLFPEDAGRGARVWRNGLWGEDRGLAYEGIVRDVISVDQNHWIVLSQLSETDVSFYEYAKGKMKMMGRITGKFVTPTLHRASDGTIWIASTEGAAYALKEGQILIHRFGPEVIKKDGMPTILYPPTLSFEVPHQGLWFWSHVQYEMPDFQGVAKPVIEGFHVYQDGQWRVVPLSSVKLGGTILEGQNEVIAFGRYTGMFRIDARNNAIKETTSSPPFDKNCIFFHRTPTGNLLLIAAWPAKVIGLASDRGGWMGQLLAVQNGRIQTLLNEVDLERVYHDKGRPVVDVPEGTLLAESRNGLIFVSADLSTIKRFDWRYGVPLPYIERMRIFGRNLYALDRERGFTVIDYRRLLHAQETPSTRNWRVFYTPEQSTMSPDGTMWRISASDPRELLRCVGTEETAVSLAGSGFPTWGLGYITTDTKNRLWLLDSGGSGHTALLENGKWRTFDRLEAAYATIAAEEKGNPGFHVGDTRNYYYPAFAGDGRVAYQNSLGRICYFDSGVWTSSVPESPVNGQRPDGPPFYQDGILTVRAGSSYYQPVDGAWMPAPKITISPYGDNPRAANWVTVLPQDFPGYQSELRIRVRDNFGAVWAGGFEGLWRGLHDLWAPFEIRNTPLQMARNIGDIQIDRAGFIWFSLLTGERARLARYQPEGPPPQLTWREPPPEVIKLSSVKIAVRITGTGKRYLIRRQVDSGEWRRSSSEQPIQDISLENLTNGVHSLRVQAFDELLRASNLLEHRIMVKRDYDQEIREWVSLLKSPDFSGREQAAKALVDLGQPALPTLTALEKDVPPDIQWWIRAIKEEIARRDALPKN